jgi:queuine tRNA-ribosyltransferase
VFSLAHRRKIKPEGVTFQSHIDGSKHLFTPESATETQLQLGADIIMAFDECTPYPCEYKYAENSMKLTHKWLDRCLDYFDSKLEKPHGYDVTFAPIVQGSTFSDLRKQSAEYIASKGRMINAIGGLSVGEPAEEMYRITDEVTKILPESSARYLMGVGTPANIITCIGLGIDMFDCVLPSRNARHGLLYTWEGIINIKNEKWKKDFSAIDEHSRATTSRNHTKAYLRHLIHVGELLGAQIATLHNLSFFLELVDVAREKILEGSFDVWSKEVIPMLEVRR